MAQQTVPFAEFTTPAAEAELSDEPWDLCNDGASHHSSPEAEAEIQTSGANESHASISEGGAKTKTKKASKTSKTSSPDSDLPPQDLPTRTRKSLLTHFIPVDISSEAGTGTGAASPSTPTANPGTTFPDDGSDTATLTDTVPLSPDTQNLIAELGYTSPNPGSNLPRSFLLAVSNRFTAADLANFKEEAELNFTQSLPYFFSGSFMFPSALRCAVNGLSLASIARRMTPATLHGYRRAKVRHQPWPAMEEKEGREVKGVLLFGMLEEQRRRIHRFEGGMFDLRRAKVQFDGKEGEIFEIDAGVYVWNQARSELCGEEEGETWRVEDLMASVWFGRVIRGAEEEERNISLQDVEL